MIVQFLIAFGILFTAGPIHNEGLGTAIEQDGLKAAVSQVWEDREALDYAKLNN